MMLDTPVDEKGRPRVNVGKMRDKFQSSTIAPTIL